MAADLISVRQTRDCVSEQASGFSGTPGCLSGVSESRGGRGGEKADLSQREPSREQHTARDILSGSQGLRNSARAAYGAGGLRRFY